MFNISTPFHIIFISSILYIYELKLIQKKCISCVKTFSINTTQMRRVNTKLIPKKIPSNNHTLIYISILIN